MKTSELVGAALDWAVAKCEGWEYDDPETPSRDDRNYKPSINWKQGGPIIEREHIELKYLGYDSPPYWGAIKFVPSKYERHIGIGPTALVAAMRCYVANKLGDEIVLPTGLMP